MQAVLAEIEADPSSFEQIAAQRSELALNSKTTEKNISTIEHLNSLVSLVSTKLEIGEISLPIWTSDALYVVKRIR